LLQKSDEFKKHDLKNHDILTKNEQITDKPATKISPIPLSPDTDSTLICQTCHKKFSTRSNYKRHLKAANCYPSLYCEICNKTFTKPALFKLHLENHKKEPEIHKCDQCSKIFTTKTHLLEHQLNRVCQKVAENMIDVAESKDAIRFKCEFCTKSYKQKKNLQSHIKQIHQKQEDFSCDLCGGIKFSTKGALTRHHKQKHQITGPIQSQNLVCKICSKQFNNKSNLKKHQLHKICLKQKSETVDCSSCGFRQTHFLKSDSSSSPLIVNCSACDSVIIISNSN